MRVAAVIPARLESTRLPGKVLLPIQGHPMLWWVWMHANHAVEDVYIATDSDAVRQAARTWGANVLMTPTGCQSGTERIVSVLDRIAADLVINVQADEPLLEPAILPLLVNAATESESDIVTPVFRITLQSDFDNPHLVKVVRTHAGSAMYFSRAGVPFLRDDSQSSAWLEATAVWGHIGVYLYRRAVLARYHQLPESPLEQVERLEQLRFLQAGCSIHTVETDYHPMGVDTPADLQRVRDTAIPIRW